MPLIHEDSVFRHNIDAVLRGHTIWSWDCHDNIVAAVVSTGEGRTQCIITDEQGKYLKRISVPAYVAGVRVTADALFFSTRDHAPSGPQLVRVDRRTQERASYPLVKGTTAFEIDANNRVWFLYGGYFEGDGYRGYNAAADQKLGSLSLDQLATALMRTGKEQLDRPLDEWLRFYCQSGMTRTVDGYVAVYDPKRNALYDASLRKLLAIDHSNPRPSRNIICLRDFVVVYDTTYIPHDKTAFAEFAVYDRREGWHGYAANCREGYYTERWGDHAMFNAIRVMDATNFVVETHMQRRLAKYTITLPPAVRQRERTPAGLLEAPAA